MFPTCERFKSWAGNRTLLSGPHLSYEDFQNPNGYVVAAYHGTTHSFDRFDSTIRGWSDGQFGAVNYFTSDSWDAGNNYTEEGADLKARADQEAEHLAWDIDINPFAYGLDDDADPQEHALRIARERHIGDNPQVLSLLLRFDNPFFLGGPKPWRIPCLPPMDELIDIDFDDEDEDAYVEAQDQAYFARESYLRDVLNKASWKLGLETLDIPYKLMDHEFNGTGRDLETILLDSFPYLEHPSSGSLMNQALVGAFIEAMGFDAIVLLNAENRFTSMTMSAGTTHIHLFNQTPGQIKSPKATRFDFDDPRFME